MFEQPSYGYEPTPAPQQESSLFKDYEVKGWLSSSGLFKVVGLSAVANIVALVVFAQTSLLTMKGCDSPLVGSVCQVLDTVYVGALLFGTDREYVDAEYDKIDLGDSEITFIDVSKETPPLTYPAGYFQLANPEEMAMVDDLEFGTNSLFNGGISGGIPDNIPGITAPSYGDSLIDTPQNLPKSNPDVIDDSTLPGNSGNGGSYEWPKPWKPPISSRKGKKRPPLAQNTPPEDVSGFPTPDPETVGENKLPSPSPTPQPTVEPTDPVTDVELNKRPFVDLANLLNGLIDKKMVDLATPFKIKATGKLDKNGKLDRKSFVYTERLSPDPRMIEVIQEAIEAMNESGYLQYLSMLNGKNLSFEVFQDNDKVVAIVESQFDSDTRANTASGMVKFLISDKKKAKESPDASQNDKDDLALLQNAKVEPIGTKLTISFMIPKGDLQAMIMKKLAEQKAQPKPTETTGGVPAKPADPAQK